MRLPSGSESPGSRTPAFHPPSTQTKYGPFPPPGFCCPGPQRYDEPLRRPLRADPFRGDTAYRARCSQSPDRLAPRPALLLGRRRGSPVPTTAVPPFHAPYAAGCFGAACPRASPLPWPSPNTPGLGSLLAPEGGFCSTRQASLHAADRWLAPSQRGLGPALRRLGLPERRRAAPTVAWSLPWPDFHRQVVVSLAGRTRAEKPPQQPRRP